MRVGILLNNVNPKEGGGYTFEEEIFKSVLSNIESTNHEIIILSFRDIDASLLPPGVQFFSLKNKKEEVKSRTKNIIKKGLRRIGLPYSFIRITPPESRFIDSLKLDLIFYPTPWSYYNLDIPFIVMVWDLQHRLQPFFPEVSNNGTWEFRETTYKRILQRAFYIICGTEVGKEELRQFYGIAPGRLKKLPHPTPDFVFKNYENIDVYAKFNLKSKYIFYPAQFWAHKNHYGLLKSLEIVIKKYGLEIDLALVGANHGNLGYVKRTVKDLGIETNVKFLGFVSQNEMVALYKNSFALVYLSYFGPENLPPLEAFALGCPVIASSVSGSEEQLAGTALLVAPENYEEIAIAINQLDKHPDLRNELIKKGLEKSKKWTGKEFILGLFEAFDEFENFRKCWGNDK